MKADSNSTEAKKVLAMEPNVPEGSGNSTEAKKVLAMDPNVPEGSGDSSYSSDTSYDQKSLTSSKLKAQQSPDEKQKLARKKIIENEDKAVRFARYMVGGAIFSCALAVSIAIFVFAAQGDSTSFELEFELYATEIKTMVRWEGVYNFALMQQLSASVTASALMTGATFPYLTQPYFEIFSGYTDGLGGIMAAGFAPLVKDTEREQWEQYAQQNHQSWLQQSAHLKEAHPGHRDPMHGTRQDHEHDRRLQTGETDDTTGFGNVPLDETEPTGLGAESDKVVPDDTSGFDDTVSVSKTIYRWENGTKVPETTVEDQVFAPLWQISPGDPSAVNMNLFADTRLVELYSGMVRTNHSVFSSATEIGDEFDFLFDPEEKDRKVNPHAFIMEPVYSAFEKSPKLVGFLLAVTSFENLFDRLLPESTKGIICVVHDSCGADITFELNGFNGYQSKFLGYGDYHESEFDEYERTMVMKLYEDGKGNGLCDHTVSIYPSSVFRESYNTKKTAVYLTVAALAFGLTIIMCLYDRTVSQRQNKTMKSALTTRALIESLFPENVRDRIMADAEDTGERQQGDRQPGERGYTTRPIADFFPNTTLMFADISGFTAWSSTREPQQVFELLETIYGAFDELAKRRRIFKVETVGDCYVAVAGIPTQRKDHAVAMARFARDCLYKMNSLVRTLEVRLGPETSALAFRVGLHSGPVTGGVLRGDNARFQLFGDTVNTAARMESTGARNRVQMSFATAELLIEGGKSHWLKAREDIVHAKGKGEMKTYWLGLVDSSDGASQRSDQSVATDLTNDDGGTQERKIRAAGTGGKKHLDSKNLRLVDWNVEVLARLLKQVVNTRKNVHSEPEREGGSPTLIGSEGTILHELREIIELPKFQSGPKGPVVDISASVRTQLRDFVTAIARLYNGNPFHNFEHASHVTMSVVKLLGRIVHPAAIEGNDASTLHDHTYGITSDPLTQFACVFSALIHDVDHSGVPNAQLVAEKAPVALAYSNKSVAEQNSVNIAWGLLMEPQYEQLRQALCATQAEKERFRQLVVNAVIATDIADKELKTLRNARWANAFDKKANANESDRQKVNRKATIVIEHLIQASDIAHTMQHWHIYRKWNERLFSEMMEAYSSGRATTDPATFWFKGEIGFFDYYIIPLAKKLKECGVFGVSSDEYLIYAMKNRKEWELRGKEIVASMVEEHKLGSKAPATPEITLGKAGVSANKAPVTNRAPATPEITLGNAGASANKAPVPKRIPSSRQLTRSDSAIFTAKSA